MQKLNAGAAAIRPLAFQGALGRAAPTRLCGVDGRDSNARVDAARGAQHGAAMIAEGLKVVCVQRVDDHIVESALGRPARRPNPRPPRDFGNSVDHEKSVRPFKGIFCRDISEFESYMPSHAVGLSVWSTTCGGAFNSCPLSSELHEGRASANIDTNPKVR